MATSQHSDHGSRPGFRHRPGREEPRPWENGRAPAFPARRWRHDVDSGHLEEARGDDVRLVSFRSRGVYNKDHCARAVSEPRHKHNDHSRNKIMGRRKPEFPQKAMEEKSWPCLYCSQEFRSKQTLVRHAQTHESRQLGWVCPEASAGCARKFKKDWKSDLRSHLRDRHPEHPWAKNPDQIVPAYLVDFNQKKKAPPKSKALVSSDSSSSL